MQAYIIHGWNFSCYIFFAVCGRKKLYTISILKPVINPGGTDGSQLGGPSKITVPLSTLSGTVTSKYIVCFHQSHQFNWLSGGGVFTCSLPPHVSVGCGVLRETFAYAFDEQILHHKSIPSWEVWECKTTVAPSQNSTLISGDIREDVWCQSFHYSSSTWDTLLPPPPLVTRDNLVVIHGVCMCACVWWLAHQDKKLSPKQEIKTNVCEPLNNTILL